MYYTIEIDSNSYCKFIKINNYDDFDESIVKQAVSIILDVLKRENIFVMFHRENSFLEQNKIENYQKIFFANLKKDYLKKINVSKDGKIYFYIGMIDKQSETKTAISNGLLSYEAIAFFASEMLWEDFIVLSQKNKKVDNLNEFYREGRIKTIIYKEYDGQALQIYSKELECIENILNLLNITKNNIKVF